MSYNTFTLTGTYKKPNGVAERGGVVVVPSVSPLVDNVGNVILAGAVSAELDTNGTFSMVLPTTGANLLPASFGYTLLVHLNGTGRQSDVTLTPGANGTTINAAQIVPAPLPAVVTPTAVTQAGLDGSVAALVNDVASGARGALSATYGALSTVNWPGTPSGGNSSYFDLSHNTSAGYLLHLHTGPDMVAPAALIGVGVGDGGATGATGILISQKSTSSGDAILLTNQSGTTGKAFHFQQNAAGAFGLYLEQVVAGAKDVLRIVANQVPTKGQALSIWQVGIISGRAGYIMSDSGDLIWQNDLRAQGAPVVAEENSGATNPAFVTLAAAQGYFPSFRDGVTTSSSTSFTSATAVFTAGDTGLSITGPGIPASTTMTFVSATEVTLSNAATATATGVKFSVGRTGTANSPGLRVYRYSGVSGKHFSWRVGMPGSASSTALEFTANNGAAAPGAETPSIRALALDFGSGNPRVGLYATVPIAQPARKGQLTDNSGGTSGGNTIAALTDVATTANAVATLAAKVNAIEAALSAAGGGIGVTA